MPRVLLLLMLAAPLLLTACDGVAEFTVVNVSSQEVVIWAFRGRCEAPPTHREDYYAQKAVRPGENAAYSTIVSGEGPGCVQATTRDGRLVVNEPYERGATLTLREPLPILEGAAASPADLPGGSFFQYQRESFRESPLGFSLMLGLVIASIGGLGLAVWTTARVLHAGLLRAFGGGPAAPLKNSQDT